MHSKEIKDKTLFLWLDANEFHARNASMRGVDTRSVYKQIPMFMKAIRRLYINVPFLPMGPWLGSWKHDLDKFNVVILHASKLTPAVARFIARKSSIIRIIIWYWNPISKCVPLEKFPNERCEIWSFDEDDVKNYQLNYNTQYYFRSVGSNNKLVKYDVFFVGSDKGRLSELESIEMSLRENGLKTYFHVVGSGTNRKKPTYSAERLTYEKVLECISESRAVVDVVAKKQTGLTLRPLEALFFKKKLITTDKDIAKRDFYNPSNIFIIGVDPMSEMSEFLQLPFVENESVANRYDFDNWLARFF